MIYKCIIVDDEPKAREILEHYISQVPNLALIAICKNAFEAIPILNENEVDVVFLDIKMPQFTGLQLVKSMLKLPKIIFTTAFSEHAAEGFDLGVTDYLLKPFSFERFMKAVNKVTQSEVLINIEPNKTEKIDFVFLKVDNKLLKILLEEIFYIEAFGNYIKIHLQEKIILATETMIGIEKIIATQNFIRVHKSYIISIDKIQSFTKDYVFVKDNQIPIGKIFRNEFLNCLDK